MSTTVMMLWFGMSRTVSTPTSFPHFAPHRDNIIFFFPNVSLRSEMRGFLFGFILVGEDPRPSIYPEVSNFSQWDRGVFAGGMNNKLLLY